MLNPRWAEAPVQVVELVTHYLKASEESNPIPIEERQRQQRQKVIESIEKKLDPLRRWIFHFLLHKAQRAVPIRDNSRYYVIKFYFPMRKVYAQFGQRWAERGWLGKADDIFFLTVKEIQSIVDAPEQVSPQELQTRIANRRQAYDYWQTIIAPDAIGGDGTPILEEEEKENADQRYRSNAKHPGWSDDYSRRYTGNGHARRAGCSVFSTRTNIKPLVSFSSRSRWSMFVSTNEHRPFTKYFAGT